MAEGTGVKCWMTERVRGSGFGVVLKLMIEIGQSSNLSSQLFHLHKAYNF